ncbi:hypothetical protein AHAS_Ahas02G0075000 [Arachis hypogaea]
MREREGIQESGRWGNTRGGKDSRVWNKEEYQRLELDSFSVFVDNLPEDISRRELFDIFKWTGRIIDIYLSRKNKNGHIYLFAFIRYTTKGGALKAIADMNSMVVRGRKLFVGEAKYRRGATVQNTTENRLKVITRNDAGSHNTRVHRVGAVDGKMVRQISDEPIKGQSSNGWTKKIEVPISSENVVWLQRSIVGGTKKAIDFNSLQQKIHRDWPGVTQVRELGAYKAMITFDSVLRAEEAYTFQMNELLKMFYMVWRWDETEKSESRRVWIECYGVPIHAWSRNTFHKIGEQWGKVVKCDKLMESGISFSAGRVLIDTCTFDMINEWIHVTIGTSGFDVLVREVGGEVYREECFRKEKEEASVRHMTNEEDIQREPMVVAWNPAVVQTTVDNREDEQGRDMMVNSSIILNEWHYKISKRLSINGNQGELNGRADSKGSCESKDSEETVSNYYEGYECHTFENVRKDNGLEERRPNIAKKRQDDGLMVIDTRSGRKEKGLDERRPTMAEKRQEDGLMVMDSRCGPAGGYPKLAGSDPGEMLARNKEESTRVPKVSTAQLGEDAGWPNRSDAGQQSASEASELSERPAGHGRKPPVPRSVAGDMEDAAGKTGMADEGGRRRSGDHEAEAREKEDRRTGVERPTIEEVAYARSDRRLKGKEVVLNAAPEAAPRTRTARNGGNRIDTVKPRRNDPEVQSQLRGDIGSRLEEGEVLVDATAESKGKGREEEHENDADSGSEAGSLDSKEHKLTWDEEMTENKEAWKLAVESGAQCSDEEDIMAILQEQNEIMALKRRQAKQKEKARRSRPKNRKQVCNVLAK